MSACLAPWRCPHTSRPGDTKVSRWCKEEGSRSVSQLTTTQGGCGGHCSAFAAAQTPFATNQTFIHDAQTRGVQQICVRGNTLHGATRPSLVVAAALAGWTRRCAGLLAVVEAVTAAVCTR
ncbi:hypothetical protein VNO80_27215 [Phaseolus coccineus]|uniref:Uncharacterized protein n=1 Tax=Phaseolus coccineus TaxID=3886 RepID=A0AAN9LJV0_PHACN